MKPFRERNPIPIAIIGLVVILLGMAAAFNSDKLPIIGGGTSYSAEFADSANLRSNDDVRVAGIKVGHVTGVQLDGTSVKITFKVKNVTLGNLTRADIRIKTLLGQKYIALTSDGDGTLAADSVIPRSRTSTPLDVTTAFIGLSQHIQQIDTQKLAQSFNVLSTTFQNTPQSTRAALTGLAQLSQTISSRDDQLRQLLGHARDVTNILADRNQQFVQLVNDADLVLQTVEQQRAVIHSLLLNTATLSQQLTGLVKENRSRLGPALANLHTTANILQRHQADLDHVITLVAPYARDFSNTIGTGRWFDSFIGNLNKFAAPGATTPRPNPQQSNG